jgi:crossover junction endodeoxyribonuclease RuvC
MIVIGVDPGIYGGLSVVSDGYLVATSTMPVVPVPYKGKTKYKVDGKSVCEFLELKKPSIVVIEDVHAMPKNGATSMFNFGYSAGVIYGAVCSFWRDCDVQFVRPQAWKKHFNLLNSNKDAARLLCLEKFPHMKDKFKLKKSSGISDSSLIALYGYFWNYIDNELNNEV